MCFRLNILLVLFLAWGTMVYGQQFPKEKIKRHFNGIWIGNEGTQVGPAGIMENEFIMRSGDTLIYSFSFDFVFGLLDAPTKVFVLHKEVFIDIKHQAVLTSDRKRYQKYLDFGLSPEAQWHVEWLFDCQSAVIQFEKRAWDDIAQDTLYQFKVTGSEYSSHSEPVNRIYATRNEGLVRVDYTIQESSLFPQKYKRLVIVSDDYMKRSRLKKYYKMGLL